MQPLYIIEHTVSCVALRFLVKALVCHNLWLMSAHARDRGQCPLFHRHMKLPNVNDFVLFIVCLQCIVFVCMYVYMYASVPPMRNSSYADHCEVKLSINQSK